VLLRPVLLTLKPLVPRLRSYSEYTPLHLQVTKHGSYLVSVGTVYYSCLIVSLVGYTSNDRIYFFCIFIAVVRIEAIDLTSEFRLNDYYYNLPLVYNTKLRYVYSDARLF
jgi:hypothetical protein